MYYAAETLADAVLREDAAAAREAWALGADSYNSYFTVVNRSIAPKVGEKFDMLRV